jgi:hypothetical protein
MNTRWCVSATVFSVTLFSHLSAAGLDAMAKILDGEKVAFFVSTIFAFFQNFVLFFFQKIHRWPGLIACFCKRPR